MLWNDPFESLVTQFGRPAAFLPAADLTVSDGDMVLTMDIPGVASESLSIELVDGHLIVRGERSRPQVAEGTVWAHSERTFGRFERRIKVPDGVDADRVTASLDNGVLSLIVPKPERLRPRTIAIDSGGRQRELKTSTA